MAGLATTAEVAYGTFVAGGGTAFVAAGGEGVASAAAQGFGVFHCVDAVNSIQTALTAAGQHGTIIEIGGAAGGQNIVCGSHANWGATITENGRHFGVCVGNMVYDNIHPNGLPLAQWLADFDAPGGIVINSVKGF